MQSLIDENLSEIVRDYKLITRYEDNLTVHLYNDPDTPPSAPQRRERWRKIRIIGRGGQSEVVLETCVDGGRHFTERAVKKIRLQGGDSKRRYESELGAIVKFSHDRYSKYFVKLLGWFASSTKLYMAMEYFPAGDLYSYVRKHEGLPEEDCRQITCQLLSAIAAMHTEGFAHRDIKPQNILIQSHPHPDTQDSWWVKLGDFGISKKIGAGPNVTTSSVGTMLYMAPELFHINCSETLTSDYREADLWSLGITIFFILTNAVPFQIPASTMKFAQNSGKPFPRTLLEHYGVTEDGQAFIRETLRPEPGTRPNFAMAMDHAWIQALFPSAPASITQSRPSTISSRRSSMSDDGSTQGNTTEISTLSSQPVSQEQYDERHYASNPPRQQGPSQGNFEAVTVNEATADVYTGTHNRLFAENESERLLNGRLHGATVRGCVDGVKMLLDQGAWQCRSNAAFVR
ncbi:camk kinase [Fusarium longipes]|uniref:Autophagy-related protein 1 n=1 Tax=Fusarium longipes TaxID=694270 RepID=A0A395SJ21_9HYPO|nr:camk kinase [Fusarium longipes]